jgi:hypothetical protein
MTHFQRTPDQGDVLVSTSAMPLLFPGVKMSLGVVSEDWRCQVRLLNSFSALLGH